MRLQVPFGSDGVVYALCRLRLYSDLCLITHHVSCMSLRAPVESRFGAMLAHCGTTVTVPKRASKPKTYPCTCSTACWLLWGDTHRQERPKRAPSSCVRVACICSRAISHERHCVHAIVQWNDSSNASEHRSAPYRARLRTERDSAHEARLAAPRRSL